MSGKNIRIWKIPSRRSKSGNLTFLNWVSVAKSFASRSRSKVRAVFTAVQQLQLSFSAGCSLLISAGKMASYFCHGCLLRLRQMPRVYSMPPGPLVTAPFHTTPPRPANPMVRKSRSLEGPPKYRESKSARMRKRKPVERSRPPAVGERKALRRENCPKQYQCP